MKPFLSFLTIMFWLIVFTVAAGIVLIAKHPEDAIVCLIGAVLLKVFILRVGK